MKNFGFELKEEDKKYPQNKINKTFHIEIKDSGEKLTIRNRKI